MWHGTIKITNLVSNFITWVQSNEIYYRFIVKWRILIVIQWSILQSIMYFLKCKSMSIKWLWLSLVTNYYPQLRPVGEWGWAPFVSRSWANHLHSLPHHRHEWQMLRSWATSTSALGIIFPSNFKFNQFLECHVTAVIV